MNYRKVSWLWSLTSLVVVLSPLLLVTYAQAALRPVIHELGNISISVDAEGNNDPARGTIQVDKPPGATVRRAFLMANSHGVDGTRVISDGDVTLAGTPINWGKNEFNGIPGFSEFFHNTWAEVTSTIKPILDPAPAGIIDIEVTETGITTINGTILVVIFDDPNQTTAHGVILLFGGQSTGGDTFFVNVAEAIDQVGGILDMGIGIGHGLQGVSGTDMVNLIDVNGSRLTSSGGGEDDGSSDNGTLITVGGIGDSNDNPIAFAPSTGFRTDDELYDLRPFLTAGALQIEVFSVNPTDDDNIFFAYFFTSSPSAILPEVTPPGGKSVVGNINPDLPTIVLTHGLQEEGEDPADLWTGLGDTQAAGLIRSALGGCAWRNANYLLNTDT